MLKYGAARKLENMLKSNRIKHNIIKQGQTEKWNIKLNKQEEKQKGKYETGRASKK